MRIPGIPYVQGRNSYTDSDGRKYAIAIHNTSNTATAEDEASYATRRTDGVSAHFYADADSVVQSLDTDARAGHAGSAEGNGNAIAVEITGANGWTRDQWLARVAWDKLGPVLAVVCREYGIPVRRATVAEMKANPTVRAFYGHDDMRQAWGGTTHTDPGPSFPWDRLFAAVTAALSPSQPTREDTMLTTAQDAALSVAWQDSDAWIDGQETTSGTAKPHWGVREMRRQSAMLTQIAADLAQLAGRDLVDEQTIVDGVLTGLGTRDLEDVAAALRASLGDQRAAELAALLAGPGGDGSGRA